MSFTKNIVLDDVHYRCIYKIRYCLKLTSFRKYTALDRVLPIFTTVLKNRY